MLTDKPEFKKCAMEATKAINNLIETYGIQAGFLSIAYAYMEALITLYSHISGVPINTNAVDEMVLNAINNVPQMEKDELNNELLYTVALSNALFVQIGVLMENIIVENKSTKHKKGDIK